ncbi:MAG: cytochrome c oxidase subunit II, partial [Gemmatimonadales bacterium]
SRAPHDLGAAWSWEPGIVIGLVTAAVLFARGMTRLRRRSGARRRARRHQAAAFWMGWTALAVALCSPLHRLGKSLLSAHMAQHELLMVVAAPLLVLGRSLVVDLVGKQWWWEIRYRDADPTKVFVTANELHIPVGRRVELRLTSTDVIHSFWVPELQGKTDLIPGRENVTWIQADRPGVYGGRCAEYCGIQHATMGLLVVAQPPAEYENWTAGQRRTASEPHDSMASLGRAAFLGSACAFCHAVRGTPAGGNAGPDLTHVASRRTLAAALLPNSAGHLGGWIANPQALKPGSRMPTVPLSREEFRRIHHYLLTLE